MLETLLPAVISLASATTGAILTYVFSQATDSKRSSLHLRTQAYVDYLRCISESAHVKRGDSVALVALNAQATDAKARICVYGTRQIIDALAIFEDNGATTNTPEGRDALVRLCIAMRAEKKPRLDDGLEANLKKILLGPNH